MTIPIIKRDQGDTAPAITTALYTGASPYDFTGASVVAVIAGTVGSGPNATYMRYVTPGTWTAASLGMGSIAFPLDPSSLAPTNYPGWVPANLQFEVRAVASSGAVTQWPQDKPVPFVVRRRL